jgi:signal transduction histidine kinase
VGGGGPTLELAERRQQFVSAVTHELRTPLTTLRLYLDMLAGGMVRDEQQRAQYLSTLCAESDRLAGLVGNVLDYAQLENGQPNVNRMPVAVQPFLAEIRQVLQPLSEAAGKSLIIESEIPHESLMFTDPGLARQILANLLDNAFKHTAGSSDNRVWLRVDRRDGQITFQVEDRGPGIAASDQKRIFSSFWRGSGKNGCPAPGVGLGLALAQRWTHLLGGSLAVESPAGELGGTRFVLVLPNQPLRTEKRCIA